MLVIFMALPERAMGDCDSFCRADGTCTSCQEVTPYPSYPTQQPTYNKPSYQPPPSQSYTPTSQTYTPPAQTYTPPAEDGNQLFMNGMMDWAIQHDAEVAAAAAEAERQRQAAEDQAQAEAAAAAAEAERKRLAAEQADDQQRNGVANPFDTASTDTGNPFARTPAKPSDVNKAIDDLLPAMQNIMDNNQSPPTATTDNPFTNTATTPPSTVTASNPFTDKTPTPDTSASNNDGNGSSEENKGIHLNFKNPFKPATAYAGDENNSGNTEPINNGKRVAHRDPNAPIPEEFTNDDPEKRREDEMNKMLEEERKKKLSPWQKAKEYVTGNKGDQPEDQPEDQPSQPKSTHHC